MAAHKLTYKELEQENKSLHQKLNNFDGEKNPIYIFKVILNKYLKVND